MHLLSFLQAAVVASLALTSIASPINTGGISVDIHEIAEKRTTLPTVEECKAQLNVAKDTTLFYSGPGGYASKARKAIKARSELKGYQILAMKWKDSSWQNTWMNDEATSKEFFNICSRALAEKTSGTAYVMLPKDTGTNWQSGTVWDKYEWDYIPKSVKVIRINPDDDDTDVVRS